MSCWDHQKQIETTSWEPPPSQKKKSTGEMYPRTHRTGPTKRVPKLKSGPAQGPTTVQLQTGNAFGEIRGEKKRKNLKSWNTGKTNLFAKSAGEMRSGEDEGKNSSGREDRYITFCVLSPSEPPRRGGTGRETHPFLQANGEKTLRPGGVESGPTGTLRKGDTTSIARGGLTAQKAQNQRN